MVVGAVPVEVEHAQLILDALVAERHRNPHRQRKSLRVGHDQQRVETRWGVGVETRFGALDERLLQHEAAGRNIEQQKVVRPDSEPLHAVVSETK